MGGLHRTKIDTLEILGEAVGEGLTALAKEKARTEFVAGQVKYLKACLKAIKTATEDSDIEQLLAEVASAVGLKTKKGEVVASPQGLEAAGVLYGWGQCIGIVFGVAKGVAVMNDFLAEIPGLTTELQGRRTGGDFEEM